MHKLSLFVALSALALPAFADTLAVDGKVLVDGDSVAKVHQLLGQPDRIVQNQTRFGGVVSETYEYFFDGKTVRVEIRDGEVAAIDEAR